MRILDRYLVRSFLAALLYCLAIFFIVFMIIDAFNNLDEFIRNSVPPKVIFSYYAYFLPTITVQVLPVAALVAVLYALGHLNRHHEILAMKASGISAMYVLLPYLFAGVVLSFFLFFLNETIVPQSSVTSAAIMEGLIEKGRHDLDQRSIRNVALRGQDNRMIFAREFELSSHTLHDIVLLEDSPYNVLQTKLSAKKARYENGHWIFEEAMQYQTNRRGELVGEPTFSKELEMAIPEKPEDFVRGASQIEFMNSAQLREHIRQIEGWSKKNAQRLSVDLHYKTAFPFVCLVVMLIGSPLAIRSGRSSAVMGIGTSLVIVLLYYGIVSVCLALGKGGYLPPVFAAWFGNLLFAMVGIYLIRNSS